MHPNTLKAIDKIWDYRATTKIPLCFTLDAGANVHLLYPKVNTANVQQFIQDELLDFCQNKQFIKDEVGHGAKKC